MQEDPNTSYRELLKMSVQTEKERREIQDQFIQTEESKNKQGRIIAEATQRLEQLKREIEWIPSNIMTE